VTSAYDLDVLYPDSLLTPTGIVFDGFLGDASQFEVLESASGGNTAPGIVDFAAVSLLSDAELLALQAPNSGFRLATLNFLGTADGVADFQFSFSPGNDVKCGNNQVCIPSVPEPGITALVVVGAAWLGAVRNRRSKPGGRGRRHAFTALACCAIVALTSSSALAQKTDPPDRNGALPGMGDNVSCPPGPDAHTKGVPNAALGDKNVAGDGKLDYYMGEWKFDDLTKDLIIRKWCINVDKDPAKAAYSDFFSFEVITSLGGVETVRKKPDTPQCPYDGGLNLPSGYEDQKDFSKVPTRVDWISGNPVADRANRLHPDEDYRKTIVDILADQTVAIGTIRVKKDKAFADSDFSGRFKIGGAVKDAGALTAADKKVLEEDFKQEKSNVKREYPGLLATATFPRDSTIKMDDDSDGDGVTNAGDNCAIVFNPEQIDSNRDGVGDACSNLRPCDVDLNGTVDFEDISFILDDRGLPRSKLPGPDLRDSDRDGRITVNDARRCTAMCTFARCQKL
jgi:hypothetical protein